MDGPPPGLRPPAGREQSRLQVEGHTSGFRIASDTLQWLAALLAGREYMEGHVDGLHHARLRAQWMYTLVSKRCYKIHLVGYVDGVRCDHESRLARVRLN